MPVEAILGQPADPLAAYGNLAVVAGTTRPVPLVATRFALRLDGGLATVTTTRIFRNAEADSIEATMTFPVPVHATLFKLEARIAGRVLSGQARQRGAAREGYEVAIDRGRTAVLHEEVLRGVHMISVGHVPPGEEIAVTCTWAMPMSLAADGTATLHIPVTVGDVYGRPPMPDSDAPAHGGPRQDADVEITGSHGQVTLAGAALVEGRARVRLDRPIRVSVSGWRPGTLHGVAADGRAVALQIEPADPGTLPLDAAILVDRSGSMNEAAGGLQSPRLARDRSSGTKHGVVTAALRALAQQLDDRDRLDLWQFANDAQRIAGASFADAVGKLADPDGGTELGAAIRAALAVSSTRDLLLITDGKSYAVDVQEFARSGRRIHVLLIGEDSLEANVGHLAALTGGSIFVANGDEAGLVLPMAIAAMRTPHVAHPSIEGPPTSVEACRGGLRLSATWTDAAAVADPAQSRSVACVAAAMALPLMSGTAAASLAEAEGLVCHLTSLLLVDEQGAAQEGLPAQRKIEMMSPATSGREERLFCLALMDADVPNQASAEACQAIPAFLRRQSPGQTDLPVQPGKAAGEPPPDLASALPVGPGVLRSLAERVLPVGRPRVAASGATNRTGGLRAAVGVVDWATDPEALRRADLSGLPAWVADQVRLAAASPEVAVLAQALGVGAEIIVMALLARAEGPTNRSADRFARTVLAGARADLVTAAAASIGL